MIAELTDARRRLEAAGLTVRTTSDDSLWIAGQLAEVEPGLHLSNDACAIQTRNGEFVGVLPSAGHVNLIVPGPIPDLVSLILAAYLRHRRQGGLFHEAIGTVLKEEHRMPVAGAA